MQLSFPFPRGRGWGSGRGVLGLLGHRLLGLFDLLGSLLGRLLGPGQLGLGTATPPPPGGVAEHPHCCGNNAADYHRPNRGAIPNHVCRCGDRSRHNFADFVRHDTVSFSFRRLPLKPGIHTTCTNSFYSLNYIYRLKYPFKGSLNAQKNLSCRDSYCYEL